MQVWKAVAGYEGYYEISDTGIVRSCPRIDCAGRKLKSKILNQRISTRGYYTVDLSIAKTQKTWKVHRLVAITYLDNPNNLECVNHKNCNKLDNCVNNLEWCTHLENMKHAAVNQRFIQGKNHHKTTLIDQDVINIRNSGKCNNTLAKEYGVTLKSIKLIKQRKRWVNLK